MKHSILDTVRSALMASALLMPVAAMAANPAKDNVQFKSAEIDGLNIAYREAGDPSHPTVLLLHGFPASSQMFRNLIPELAKDYYVIAPDFPGYGASDMPDAATYEYSFANTATTVTKLLDIKGVNKYAVYLMDYGAPVRFRMFAEDPERVSGFIIQNGNAYEEGLSKFWDPIRAYWADPSEENGDVLRGFLTLDATKWIFTHGVQDTTTVSPDNFWQVQYLLDRPGNQEVQLEMFLDYATNVTEHPKWQGNRIWPILCLTD